MIMGCSVKYSFVLPAYKSKFLDNAIKSILSQTYEDFELIIINDKSPFNIKEIVDKNFDKRIKYFENSINLGKKDLIYHWNKCIEKSNGTFFIMASDDDIYKSSFLQNIDYLVSKYPNINIYRALVERIDEKGQILMQESFYQEFQSYDFFFKNFFYRESETIKCIANYVFRKNDFIKNGRFINYPAAWHSDDITVFKNSNNGIATTKEICFQFRSSKINISNLNNSYDLSLKKMEAQSLYYKDIITLQNKLSYSISKIDSLRLSIVINKGNEYAIIKLIRTFPKLFFIFLSNKINYSFNVKARIIAKLIRIAINFKH